MTTQHNSRTYCDLCSGAPAAREHYEDEDTPTGWVVLTVAEAMPDGKMRTACLDICPKHAATAEPFLKRFAR